MVVDGIENGLALLVRLLLGVQGIAAAVGLAALMAQFGVRLTMGDLRRTTREYTLALRWLVANLLFLPLAAVLFGAAFRLPEPLLLALLLVAVAPGAPFIPPIVALAGQDSHEAIRLTASLTIIATLTIPLFVAAMLFVLNVDAEFSPWSLLVPLGVVLAAPLFAGMAARTWRPALAERLGRPLTWLENVTLAFALGTAVVLGGPAIAAVFAALFGTGALLVLSLFVLVSVGLGWLFGVPTAQSRRVLALGTAGRNVNVAIFVATGAFPGQGVGGGIVAFTVLMIAVSLGVAVYWRRQPLAGGAGSQT